MDKAGAARRRHASRLAIHLLCSPSMGLSINISINTMAPPGAAALARPLAYFCLYYMYILHVHVVHMDKLALPGAAMPTSWLYPLFVAQAWGYPSTKA